MTVLGSLRPVRSEHSEPQPEPISEYAPRPTPGPHQLGSTTLAAVDALTGMTAEEIEKVADSVVAAATETADVLREAARRVRHTGLAANERLANFVRVASTCADAAKLMQASVAERDAPANPPAEVYDPPRPVDLDAIAEQIAEVKEEAGR